jgi:hypothetical protein
MRHTPRVNYDLIAPLYDAQPYRDKPVDEARDCDLKDFMPPDEIRTVMEKEEFENITVDLNRIRYETTHTAFASGVRRRDTCSQLITIPDAAYQAGLDRLDREIRENGGDTPLQVHLCLVKITGDRP